MLLLNKWVGKAHLVNGPQLCFLCYSIFEAHQSNDQIYELPPIFTAHKIELFVVPSKTKDIIIAGFVLETSCKQGLKNLAIELVFQSGNCDILQTCQEILCQGQVEMLRNINIVSIKVA